MKRILIILNLIIVAALPVCSQSGLLKNPTFKKVFNYGKTTGTSIQDMVISGDTAISFCDALKEVNLINLTTQKVIGKLSVDESTPVHCNTVSFGQRYAQTDKWPLIYVAQSSNRHATNVYRVVGNTLQLVQTITWGGYNNALACFDSADKSHIYVIAWNGADDRTPNIFKVAAPSFKESTKTINLDDETDYFSFYYVRKFEVVQGVTVKNGMMYQVRGFKNGGQLAVFDLKAKKPVQLFSLVKNGISAEPEGVDFQGDKLWICDQKGNLFLMQEQDELLSTETKSVRTLSFPDGWRQEYVNNNNEGYCKQDSCNGYSKAWTAATQDLKNTFTMENVNQFGSMNDWSFVRVGRKDDASVATITTDQPIDEAISSVVVNVQKFSKADKVNTIYLEVGSNPDFTDRQRVTINKADYKPGYMVFSVPYPKAKQYYKLTFDIKSLNSSDNGSIQFSRVSFYPQPFTQTSIKNSKSSPFSVAHACCIYDEGEGLLDTVYVQGKVIKAEEALFTGSDSTKSNKSSVYISDDGSENNLQIKAYDGWLWKNKGSYTDGDRENYLAQGNTVIIYGTLAKWHNTYELGTGNWVVASDQASNIASTTLEAPDRQDVYNLKGQKIAKNLKGITTRGIYVTHGKKVVMP